MSQNVDTNGWDTVAAITYADVNKAIAADPNTPKTFNVTATDGSVSAQGNIGAWLLRLGGSGPDIMMEITLTGGSVTGPFGAKGAQATLPISACTFPVMVRADFLPHTTTPTLLDLKLNNQAPVSVDSYDRSMGKPTTSFLGDAALQELLQQWLTANLGLFTTVFASVDLDADYTNNDGVKWLSPSYRGYAVVEPTTNATLDNSVFAVLCLIDNLTTPPSNLAYAVSSFAIPTGANAAFLISAEKFLEHMMLAAMPKMFQGIDNDPPTKNFIIDNNGFRIRNITSLTMPAVVLQNNNVVSPTVQASEFTVEVNDTELVITIGGMGFTYSPGIDVSLTYAGNSTLSYNKTTGLLDLTIASQRGSGSVAVTQGMQIAQIVLGVVSIVAAIVAAGAGFVSKAATSAITTATTAAVDGGEAMAEDAAESQQLTVTALRGLISGTPAEVATIGARAVAVARVAAIGAFCTTLMPAITGIMQAVASGNYQSVPKITDLTDAAIGKTVIWPKAVGTYTLDSAQLNGCLQFGLVRV